MSVNLLNIGFSPNVWWLGAGMFVAGFCDSVGDVGNNMHGLRVQRGYGRSIINSFHGIWSVGAVVGGVLGSTAAGLHVSVPAQLTATAAVFLVVSLACSRLQLPGPDQADRPPGDAAPERPRVWGSSVRVLATLGALAALAGVVEDSGASWGALFLSTSLGAGPGLAGSAFLTMAVCMTVGRLTGDRLVDRYGERTVAATGAALAAAALAAALTWPSIPLVLVGFGLAGLGTATMIPAAMHAADHLVGLPPGAALTVVSLITRLGFLLSPPLVGIIADSTSLRIALITVPLAALTALAAPGLSAAHRRHADGTEVAPHGVVRHDHPAHPVVGSSLDELKSEPLEAGLAVRLARVCTADSPSSAASCFTLCTRARAMPRRPKSGCTNSMSSSALRTTWAREVACSPADASTRRSANPTACSSTTATRCGQPSDARSSDADRCSRRRPRQRSGAACSPRRRGTGWLIGVPRRRPRHHRARGRS